jgi:LuxR family transcriptional regulator, maltose regulon positive regulatory protein
MIVTVGAAGTPGSGTGKAVGPDGRALVSRPALFGRLGGQARVTVVSAPPGSGKTVLLRSWISHAGLAERAGWVAVGRDERDPQRFWLAVQGALRRTAAASALVQAVTAAPDLEGWAITERLLTDLASLEDRIWLVIDDVHELSPDAVRQLELLVLRAPGELRFVLATRHDARLGLHRLRLEGELSEIRSDDLRFTVAEARELLDNAGVQLPESAVVMLHERTEGWVAGLRLAALSLARHPDPGQMAATFSGTERTVAEYLLAEVLDRQSEQVRLLLLRTSMLERVNGELADLLTGDSGGERVLQDLEQAGAFVVSLDAARTWFRYHQMFAGLLQLELRRTAPGEIAGLHQAACGWFAAHGYPVEAMRHAQASRDWELAARLLADHWPSLHLDGQDAAVHELLAGFPPGACAADAQLAAVAAADELARGSLEEAERYLGLAERGMASVPDTRHRQARLLLGIARLLLARQRGNLSAAAEEARRLEAMAEAHDAAQPALGQDLRALALINLGYAQGLTARLDQADYLEQGIALARRIGRPYLEFTGLAYQAAFEHSRSLPRAAERGRQAVEMAERHGWTDENAASIAYVTLGSVLAWQGRLEEAKVWSQRTERTVRAELQPIVGMGVYHNRAVLELGRGQVADALAAFRAAERLAGLAGPHPYARLVRAWLLQGLMRLGETQTAEQVLAGLDEQERERGEIRITTAVLRLTHDEPHAATAALAPVLDGSAPLIWPAWLTQAFLLEAIAQDALGDEGTADRALEYALDRAEPDSALLPFLLYPAEVLLERHARRRTSHAALIAEILSLLPCQGPAAALAGPRPLTEPLSESELRVLRYLPTNLTAPEIAGALYVSLNTVKTHMRNLYAKLGTHRRAETVTCARALGLLAPSARHR